MCSGARRRLPTGCTGIARLNYLSRKQAASALFDCCGSKKWVERVLAHRPFADESALLDSAEEAFASLGRKDWLTIFRSHPAIGAKKAAAKQTTTARDWSAGEQALAQKGSAATLAVLGAANEAYEATFGHVFLICATGKSSEQILQEPAGAPGARRGNGNAHCRRRAAQNHAAASGETTTIMSQITTHVLDTSLGRPAAGVPIILEIQKTGGWQEISKGATDADGRLRHLLEPGALRGGDLPADVRNWHLFSRTENSRVVSADYDRVSRWTMRRSITTFRCC